MTNLNQNFDHEMIASSVDEGDFSEQRLGSDFQGDIRATASFNPAQFNNIHYQHQNNFMQNFEESPITRIQFPISNENISHDINQYSLRGSQMQNSQNYKISGSGSIKNQINPTYKQNNSLSSSGDARLQKLKNLKRASNSQNSNLQKSFESNQKDGAQEVQNIGSGYGYSVVQKDYLKSQLKPNGLQNKMSSDSQKQSQIQKLERPLSQSSGQNQKVVPPPSNQRNIKIYVQENDVKYITSMQQLNEVQEKTAIEIIQRKTSGQGLFYSLQPVDILKKQFKKQPALQQPVQAKILKSQQNIQNPQTSSRPATSNNQQKLNYLIQGQSNIINTTVSPKLNINSITTNPNPVLNRYFASSSKQKIHKIQQSQQNINTGPILQTFSSGSLKTLSQSNSTPQLDQNTQLSKILANARQYRHSQIQNSSTNFSSINQNKYAHIISTPNSPKNQFIERPQSIATPYNNIKQQNIRERRYVAQNNLQQPVSPQILHQLSKSPSSPQITQTPWKQLISKQQQPQLIPRQSRLFAKVAPPVDKKSLSFGSNDSKTKPPVYFTYTSNPSQTQPSNPTTPQNKNLYQQQWQTRVKKLEIQHNKSKQYIIKIQQQNKKLKQELIKFINVNNNNNEYFQLIKNQQLIIRELQYELNKNKINQNVSKPNNDQQYIIIINTLEARIKQLQRNSNSNPQSQKKYTQIIQKQRSLIQNIENNFKQSTKNSVYREQQLKSILQNQQSIINTLEEQIKRIITDSGQINKQRQKQLFKQIEQKKVTITELQFQLRKQQERINQLREQLVFKNKQVLTLKQQRTSYQRTIQDKLEQKLVLIQQQLKNKPVDSKYHQSSRTQTNQNRQQIQQLMQENDRLVLQLRKRQQQKQKIQQQLINQQENMRRKVMEKESQIRLFNDNTKLLEEEHKRKLNNKDKKIKQLQEQIQNLNIRTQQNINSPRSNQNIQSFQILSPSNNSNSDIRNLKQKLSIKQQELSQAIRHRQNTEKKYQTLQANFNSVDQQNAKKVQELMNLKRQLSNYASFQSEIKTLAQTINKKNQEIIELKTVSFQKGQLKIQLQSVKNQRNNLKATLQTKNQQIDRLKQAIAEIKNRMRQTKQRQTMFPSSNQSLVEEIQVMYESVKKKQAQLNKIKQANQLLQTNIQQLQYELQRAKSKIVLLEKNVVHQKQQIVKATLQYENRIKDLQNKAKNLQQSQKNSKTSFTLQLQNMENAIKDKDQALRKLQSQNKVFKNKLKNHESKTQQYDTQIQNLNKKIKQTQASKQQMKKHIQTLQAGNLTNMNTKKLYDEYQIKIVELQAAIKVKDSKIKQLEETVQTTKIKNNYLNNQENFINQQQLQVLRKKVAQYESKLIAYGTRGSYKPRKYESTLVFEQRAIYELKVQNERLKQIIAEKGNKYSSHQNISASKTNFELIQKRLIDFNEKLQEMMEENKKLQQKNPDFSFYLEPKHQNLHFERQRTQLVRKHKNQMLALQARLVDLQRYCSSFQNIPNNSSISFSGNNKFIENAKGIYADQLNYYKQKNKQLEERIDSHIKLNKQLKQKVESLLKSNGDSTALQFYRLQILQMQKQTAENLIKIKYLSSQNKNIKQQYQNLKNDNTSEIKVTQLQNKIHEQNRKISQLQMQNGILQSDLNKYMQQLRNMSEQVQKHKTANQDRDQKLFISQQSIRQANNKINNYQLQIVKLNNQLKLLQAENQRINEKFTNKQGQEIGENSKLRSRLVQIQNQLRQYQQNSNGWAESKASYELTITNLNGKVSNLENELFKLNTLSENLNKKTKQADAEYFALQSQYQNQKSKTNELEILLNQKQLEIESMNQFLERIRKQRDNEGSQSKQRLGYINQMEVSIKSLKIQITQYKSQLQKIKIQNTEYRQRIQSLSSLQQIIKQLRMEVQFYKNQIQRQKSTIDQLRQKNITSSQLQQTIQQLRQQILRYKADFQKIKRQKDQQFNQISRSQAYIQSIQQQLHNSQQIIQRIAYRLQFLRSYFIEIQTLHGEIIVNQENKRQIQVLQKIRQSISNGLKFCAQTFTLL